MMKIRQLCSPQHRLDLMLKDDHWTLLLYTLIATCTFMTVGRDDFYSQPHVRKKGLYLIPYFVLLVIMVLPIIYVQIRLGQSRRQNILELFSRSMPLFKGVAACLLLMTYLRASFSLGQASSAFYTQVQTPVLDSSKNKTTRSSDALTVASTPLFIGGKLVLLSFAMFISALSVIRGPSWFSKMAVLLSSFGIISLLVTLMTSQLNIKAPKSMVPYGVMMSSSLQITDFMVKPINQSKERTTGLLDYGGLTDMLESTDVWIAATYRHMDGMMLWSGLLPSLGRNTKSTQYGHPCWPWLVLILYQSLTPFISWFFPDQSEKLGEFTSVVRSFTSLIFCIIHQGLVLVVVQECLARRLAQKLRDIHYPEVLLLVLVSTALVTTSPYAVYVGLPHSETPAPIRWYQWLVHNLDRTVFILIILSLPPIIAAFARLHEFDLGVKTIGVCVTFVLSSILCSTILLVDLSRVLWPLSHYQLQSWWLSIGWLVVLAVPVVCVVGGALITVIHASGDTIGMKLRNSLKPVLSNDENLPLVLSPNRGAEDRLQCKPSTSRDIPETISIQSSMSGASDSMSMTSTGTEQQLEVTMFDDTVDTRSSDGV